MQSCARRLLAVFAALLFVHAAVAQTGDLYDPEIVRDLRIAFAQPDWWQQLEANYSARLPIAATLRVDGGPVLAGVGVRFRGNTSYALLPPGSQKKSFDVQIDWQTSGQKVLGYSRMNLNNAWQDPTFLREFLTYRIMGRHGISPHCALCRLWLNGSYWGVYVHVQQPNEDMLAAWFRDSHGNSYRAVPPVGTFDGGRCAMSWLGPDPASYLQAYDAKRGDGTDLMQLCNVLANTPAAGLQAALPAVLDVDQFYRYAAVMNVVRNLDSYIGTGKEHYLYHDPLHGDTHVFPFDLNEAFRGDPALDPWYATTDPNKPALQRTLAFADWRARYLAHYRTVVERSLDPAWLVPTIQHFHALIAADVAADTRKLYPTAAFQANLTGPVTVVDPLNTITLPGLLPFVQARWAALQARPELQTPRVALDGLQVLPAAPPPGHTFAVRVHAVGTVGALALWWRAQGPYQPLPMVDDGRHGDGAAGDGVYGALVPPQAGGAHVDYYVEATTPSGVASYLPADGEFLAPNVQVAWPVAASPIVVNEFVAQNVHGPVDEHGQHEDWVELYNRDPLPVDVSGLQLADNLLAPSWPIPAGTVIPGHGVLRIWCDNDLTQGPLHANFKLAAAGEAVALYTADGQALIDAYVFGPQTADVSTGRLFDGGLPWVTFAAPTFEQRNELATCGVRSYGAPPAGAHVAQLALAGAPRLGATPVYQLTGAPPGGLAAFGIALAPAVTDLGPFGAPGVLLLLAPATTTVAAVLPVDAGGAASMPQPVPNTPALLGLHLYAQAVTAGGNGLDSSNALELAVCP